MRAPKVCKLWQPLARAGDGAFRRADVGPPAPSDRQENQRAKA